MLDLIRQGALAAAMALAPQPEVAGVSTDARDGLFDKQLEVFECESPVFFLLCSRRAGKTVGLCPRICEAARENPRTFNPYISITKLHARHMVWPTLKAVGQRLGGIVNNSLLTITFPGEGVVALGGMDTLKELEKLRGGATAFAVVDECGTADPTFLEYLHLEVLGPATIDYGGQIAFAGTPGQFMVGWWYDKTKVDHEHAAPVFRWTLRDNFMLPQVASGKKTHDEIIQQILADNEWDLTSPKFVREYLGQWCEDPTGLCFPLTSLNMQPWAEGATTLVEALPRETPTGHRVAREGWRFVIGGDDGWDDDLAMVVTATHPDLRNDYIVSSEKHSHMLSPAVADRFRELQAEFPGSIIVFDFGGGGKRHAMELSARYGVPMTAAEKTDKESAVRIMHDRVRSGRTKVLDGPQNDPLREEWAALGWCEKARAKGKRLPKDGNDHASDAALYSMRKQHHYTNTDTPSLPDPNTQEGHIKLADDMKAARVASLRKPRGERPAWDR